MSRVPRAWRFSDPTKWERITPVEPCAKYPRSKIEWYMEVNNNHKSRTPRIYSIYEDLFEQNLGKLEEYEVIFITGLSPDLTEVPNPFGFYPKTRGLDLFQDQNRLSNEIMKIHAELGPEKLEHILYFPIAPISMPARIKKKGDLLILEHPLREVVDEANRRNGRGFGRTYKILDLKSKRFDLTPHLGNYEFSRFYYQKPQSGRDFYDDNEPQIYEICRKYDITRDELPYLVGLARYIHRRMLGERLKRYVDILGLENPPLYALNTSYAFDVMKDVACTSLKIGRNLEFPHLGEAEPSALNVLKGYLEEFI